MAAVASGGDVALGADELLDVAAAGQPCAHFGVHHALPLLRALYAPGEAAAGRPARVLPVEKKAM